MTDETTLREKQERELSGLQDIHRREVADNGGNLEPDHDPNCSEHGNTALDDQREFAARIAVDRMAEGVLAGLLNEGASARELAHTLAGFLYIVLEEDSLAWALIWDDAVASIEEHRRGGHE